VEPAVGQIVRYRLTREEVRRANRLRVEYANHRRDHRERADGAQVHDGNQHAAGDVVPLMVVRVWSDQYQTDKFLCRDYLPETEPEWSFPASSCGVNGQAFLDGSDVIWVTGAPEGDFNGGWLA
jgi:hypothetical protein